MGKIVATYLVKVTLRQKAEPTNPDDGPEPLSIDEMERVIEDAIADYSTEMTANAAGERTDV